MAYPLRKNRIHLEETQLINPARRLHDLLTQAFGYQGQKTQDVWRAVLCSPDDSDRDLLWALLALQALTDETESLVGKAASPGHIEEYTACFPEIRQAIAVDKLQQEWNSVRGHLSDQILIPLKFGGLLLDSIFHERSIDQAGLDGLRSQIAAVRETVRASDLDAAFKRVLLDQLDEMDRALRLYRISGAQGLRTAFRHGLGVITLYRDRFKTWWNDSTLKPFVEILSAINLAASHADSQAAIEWAVKSAKALLESKISGP